MATYKGIKGFKVQNLSSNAIASQVAGGTWASGGDLNTARQWLAAAGTKTATLAIDGEDPAGALAASYDGSSWTAVTAISTARG